MPDNSNRARRRPASGSSAGGSQDKDGQLNRPETAKAKREQHVQKLVASAPPLSADQLARLAVLLQGRG